MEDGDTEKYHVSRVIQDFVFSSRKKGCIRCISLQVYNIIQYLQITLKRSQLTWFYTVFKRSHIILKKPIAHLGDKNSTCPLVIMSEI